MPRLLRALISSFLLGLIVSAPGASAREAVPAPEPDGSGVSIIPGDNRPGSGMDVPEDWLARREAELRSALQDEGSRIAGDIGGDDITGAWHNNLYDCELVVDSYGTLHVAVEHFTSDEGYSIGWFRSYDGGTNWTYELVLHDASPNINFFEPSLAACDGNVNRLYLTYTYFVAGQDREIRMIHTDLDGTTGFSWSSEITVLAEPGTHFGNADLADDSASYNTFYLYVVAEGDDGLGQDIWYTRSIDYGASFETGYEIATLDFSDRAYSNPRVCYGYGALVHAVWDFEYLDHGLDGGIRYRRSPSFGGGGLAGWDFWQVLASDSNGTEEKYPVIAAALDQAEVMIAYNRMLWQSQNGYYLVVESGSRGSADQGVTWENEVVFPSGLDYRLEMEFQPGSGDFILGGLKGFVPGVMRANRANLSQWSAPEFFGDQSYYGNSNSDLGLAVDATRDGRLAMAWAFDSFDLDYDMLKFDAEWRRDHGYPNFEDGFPVDLNETPLSPPGLADVDGDGDLEIVFSGLGNTLQVYHHDGTPLAGWPVDVGEELTYFSPVAVGDLDGDGRVSVVAGTGNGLVVAYGPEGLPEPGFPAAMPEAVPVSVSLGALGWPEPRTIVATAGSSVCFFDSRGRLSPEVWSFPDQNFQYPAAIGDLDGDGRGEVIVAGTDEVWALSHDGGSDLWSASLPNEPSAAPSLADLDLDGDVEVIIPSFYSTLYVKDGDGSDFPGFPLYLTGANVLSQVAVAQIFGGFEPEMSFATSAGDVYLVHHTGQINPNYPVNYGYYPFNYAGPIMGDVDTFPAEVIFAGYEGYIFAWRYLGGLLDGWGRNMFTNFIHAPALGDLDGDNQVELVLLTPAQLMVMNLDGLPQIGNYTWPMIGHNPARTSCLDCYEDLVSGVEGEDGVSGTMLSFAQPAPNPSNGPTLFSFTVPERARARLEVYDLRGHRVRTVLKEELPAGPHVVNWDGRDGQQRQLASGVYFARLKVSGPGLNEELTRKINLLR